MCVCVGGGGGGEEGGTGRGVGCFSGNVVGIGVGGGGRVGATSVIESAHSRTNIPCLNV